MKNERMRGVLLTTGRFDSQSARDAAVEIPLRMLKTRTEQGKDGPPRGLPAVPINTEPAMKEAMGKTRAPKGIAARKSDRARTTTVKDIIPRNIAKHQIGTSMNLTNESTMEKDIQGRVLAIRAMIDANTMSRDTMVTITMPGAVTEASTMNGAIPDMTTMSRDTTGMIIVIMAMGMNIAKVATVGKIITKMATVGKIITRMGTRQKNIVIMATRRKNITRMGTSQKTIKTDIAEDKTMNGGNHGHIDIVDPCCAALWRSVCGTYRGMVLEGGQRGLGGKKGTYIEICVLRKRFLNMTPV